MASIPRKRKKKHRLRGDRTHGKGNTKNKRGKGSNAGKGNAGFLRSKWTWTVVYDPDRFGKHGFKSIHKKEPCITLEQINNMILKGILKKEGDVYLFEFNGKVIGTGDIRFPLKLKAKKISNGAKQKILSAGGSVAAEESKVG